MRVYEYAKSLNMSSREIITILKRLELPVSNHMSVMDEAMIQKVEQFFRKIKDGAADEQKSTKQQEATTSSKTNKGSQRPTETARTTATTSERSSTKNTSSSQRSQTNKKSRSSHYGSSNNRRQGGRGRHRQQQRRSPNPKPDNTPKKIIVRGPMTVGELAKLLHKDVSEVIKKLMMLGMMVTINQEIDLETIQMIADDYKVEVEVKIPVDDENIELIFEEEEDEASLRERPPVVTIMGHVDHGKTT